VPARELADHERVSPHLAGSIAGVLGSWGRAGAPCQ
jgi:hypothetical protein